MQDSDQVEFFCNSFAAFCYIIYLLGVFKTDCFGK